MLAQSIPGMSLVMENRKRKVENLIGVVWRGLRNALSKAKA